MSLPWFRFSTRSVLLLLGLLLAICALIFLSAPTPAFASTGTAAASPATLHLATDPLAPLAVQQAELSASDGANSNYFGCSVALSGDTALVGTPGEINNKLWTRRRLRLHPLRDDLEPAGQADRLRRGRRRLLRLLGGALRRHGPGRRLRQEWLRWRRLRLHALGDDLEPAGRAERPGRGHTLKRASTSAARWRSPATPR